MRRSHAHLRLYLRLPVSTNSRRSSRSRPTRRRSAPTATRRRSAARSARVPRSCSRGPASTRPTTGATRTRRAPRPTSRPNRKPASDTSTLVKTEDEVATRRVREYDMIRGKCPICAKPYEIAVARRLAHVPVLLASAADSSTSAAGSTGPTRSLVPKTRNRRTRMGRSRMRKRNDGRPMAGNCFGHPSTFLHRVKTTAGRPASTGRRRAGRAGRRLRRRASRRR